jgi:phosphate transport system protein
MLKRILDTFGSKKTLLDEAMQDSVMMLVSTRRMYDLVMVAIKDDAGDHVRNKIATMDKEVNRQQREVRQKVFEHLSLSRGEDLMQGLELVMSVIDIERIGDYTKNISELIEMMPGALQFGEFEATYEKAQSLASEVFDRCVDAFARNDVDAARVCMDRYQQLALLCDRSLERLIGANGSDDVPRPQVALVLLLRYLKRVGAHLKNVASVKVNPFHRIGYRPKS